MKLLLQGLWMVVSGLLALTGPANAQQPVKDAEQRVEVSFSDGHETDRRDHGRPVVLIAGALGVSPDVFRKAFSNVTPAPAGREPDPDQVRRNKDALLRALGPYGITNARLDRVSDYYRYNGRNGGLWPHTPAKANATIRSGVVTGFTLTDAGSGYSSTPSVSVPGFAQLKVVVTLAYGADFKENGSVSAIALDSGKGK